MTARKGWGMKNAKKTTGEMQVVVEERYGIVADAGVNVGRSVGSQRQEERKNGERLLMAIRVMLL